MRTAPALAAVVLSACATANLPPPNAPAAPAEVEVKATGKPGQASAERSLKLGVTVIAVDDVARTITVKGIDGKPELIKVPPDVARLTEVSPGDTLELELRQGLLLEVQPAGAAVVAQRDVAVAGWSGLTDPPAGAGAQARQATVTVAAIDQKARLVTFQGPAGNQYQVKVGTQLALEKLKVGDKLLATYVESTAVSVSRGGRRP